MSSEMDSVAIFIASSDNTRDVFERVFPTIRRQWPDCPYPIYAGFNRPFLGARGFTPIYAPVTGWGSELRAQIAQVPAERILLFLDDFVLLERVDTDRVKSLVEKALSFDLAYLSFRQLRRAALPRFLRKCTRWGVAIEPVPERYPYYSSLQVALWKKGHLLRCLEREGNIWNFERLRPEEGVHHVICGDGPMRYRHIVEKGRWLPVALKALSNAGVDADLGERPMWKAKYQMRHMLRLVRFEIIGYSAMRARETLSAFRSRVR